MSDDVKILSRADFLAAVQMKREAVPVPELGGTVYISQLYAAQLLDYNEMIRRLKKEGMQDVTPSTPFVLMARLVSMAACDAKGNQLFTEADVTDLAKSHPRVLLTLSIKAMELSGITNDAIDEVVDQLKKNQTLDSSIS